VLVKPLTIRLIVYGQKANIAAINKRAKDFLKDEHGKIDPTWLVDAPADDIYKEILETRWDHEVALKKPGKSNVGFIVTLPEVNKRMADEWLHEIPVAKTCVVFATWIDPKENLHWQLQIIDTARWSDSRPVADQ
jgi:hypothetical protein